MKNLAFSKSILLIPIFVAIFLIGISTSHPAFAQGAFHGAIYTTINDGSGVNVNQFDSKPEVYLNGGPQNNNANGLPNGIYFYQVTDPSGATLLSTDRARCRQLQVVGGRIFGSVAFPGSMTEAPCAGHANGMPNMANNTIPVQLIPFLDTPNNGGVYKVWLIRMASTTSIAADGIHIDFNNNNSKTDNFRIRDFCEINPDDPTCNQVPDPIFLSGHKFYDANANTLFDMGELPVAGVQIVIEIMTPSGPLPTVVVTTDANGDWTAGPFPAGSTFTVYENLPCVDANADMVCDANPPNYWVQTAPVPDGDGFQGYVFVANASVTGLNFGDICFHQASGGYTLGFWSNKNGMANMNGERSGVNVNVFPTATDNPAFPELGLGMAGDLNFLKRLNLKTTQNDKFGNALNFDPTGYAPFRTWLLNGNAVNMAYMLSVQLSATSLDCRHEFLSDSQIVDGTSVGLGITSIGAVRMGANTSLNNYTWTISGDPHRQSQEMMKDFLDGVNNNRLPFGSAMPCSVFYPQDQ